MADVLTSRKPIEIEKAGGLVLTCKLGQGVRISIGETPVDVIFVQNKGGQIRLAISTGEVKHPIDRLHVKGWV